jgi:hypothetical protein
MRYLNRLLGEINGRQVILDMEEHERQLFAMEQNAINKHTDDEQSPIPISRTLAPYLGDNVSYEKRN